MLGQNGGDVETVSSEHAALEVVDDDVGAGDERANELAIRGEGEVGGEALLVAVDAQIIGALAGGVEGRSPAAGVVARAGSLDLDDVGAEIAKEHGGEGPGQNSTQIEHVDIGKHYLALYIRYYVVIVSSKINKIRPEGLVPSL
jgi:hypothetical protein